MKHAMFRFLAWPALAGASALTLMAQTAVTPPPATTKEETFQLGTFTVTGSNIRRQDAEKTLPVTTVSREGVDLSGGVTTIELLQTLPFIGATVINEGDAKSSVGARGDVSFANLRSLPSGNTLVLTNGRRMVPHGIAQATDGATGSGVGAPALSVNIATLSQAAIERVEVLRDGASAVYGSDASAGVINHIMARKMNGWTLRGRYGASFEGGLDQTAVSISGGQDFNDGRTNVSLTLDLLKRDGLDRSERDWALQGDLRSSTPAPWDGVAVAGVTNNAQLKTSIVGYVFRVGGITTGVRPTGNLGITTTANNTTALTASTSGQFWIVPGSSGPTIMNSTPSATAAGQTSFFSTNALGARTVIPGSGRLNLFATVDHQLTDTIEAYADFALYRARSIFYREPNTASSTVDNPFVVSANNPYNPFGSRFYDPAGTPNTDGTPRLVGTPQPVYLLTRQFWELNRIKSQIDNQALRAVLGLKGRIGSTWNWDAGLLAASNEVTDRNVAGMVRISKLREALARTGSDAFNPFGTTFTLGSDGLIRAGANYTNPAAVTAFVQDNSSQPARYGETGLFLVDAKASGAVWELPAGPLSVALGGEFRHESYLNDRDPFFGTNPANAGTYFNSPTASAADYVGEVSDIKIDDSRNISSGYAEVVVPVFAPKQNLPLLRALEFSAAGRVENYSTFGTVTKPKYGAMWEPHRALKIRAAYSESFLAPNMAQTYPGYLYRFVNAVTDPYRFTVTGLSNTDGPNTVGRLALRGGGQSLQPETATNRNLGVVFSPPWVKGLTITVDYWSLKQRNAISSLGAATLLQRDEALLNAFVQSELAAGKTITQIDLGSGTANYKGLSLVTRSAVSSDDLTAFATYNAGKPAAQQRAAVGAVTSVVDAFLNLSARNIEGYDVEVEYRLPKSESLGRLVLNVSGAYQSKYEVQSDPSKAMVDYRSFNRDLIPIPLWRGNSTLTWTSPRNTWTGGVMAIFQGSWQDTRLTTTTAVREALGNPDYISSNNLYIVPEQWYFNVFAGHTFKAGDGTPKWLANTTVRFGVNNVLDRDPQVTGSVSYYESAGSPLALQGRSFYLEFKKRL